jgi:segregation and condensation protein A
MSLSATAATDLAAPSERVPREAAERVLDYLVFHRSLLGESDAPGALLERYLTLVNRLKEGVHVVIPDPYQKATALLFELVMEEAFDPWEIDLARFTQAYLERVKAEGGVDFAVAGRLLYMAWSILYLQSVAILRHRETPPDPGAAPEEGAADDSYVGAIDTPEGLDVTTAVLGSVDAPPLVPMVRHAETRPVSLLELVSAFGEAEADARRALRVQELRERLREEQRAPPEVLVHGDIPERDLADTWEVALTHAKGEPFSFLDLWRPTQGRDRLVAVFLACLFLARERVLDLTQASIGAAPLLLVRLADARAPAVEE